MPHPLLLFCRKILQAACELMEIPHPARILMDLAEQS